MPMVAARPGAPDLADVAAVGMAAVVDEVVDLEPRLIRYRGQESLGVTCGDE